MEDGRPRSGAGGETAAVLGSGEDCRLVALSSRQAKVAHVQALIICFLETVMTWTNAKNEDTAVGEYANAVFHVASVTKTFGLAWALFSALRAFWNGETDCWSGGSPIMMTWGATSTAEHPGKHAAVMLGLGLQAIGTWISSWDFVFGEDLGAVIAQYFTLFILYSFWGVFVMPTIAYFQQRLGDPGETCAVQVCIREKREIPARILSSASALYCITAPIAVYILESVLLFVSGSDEPATYMLAVLDVVMVILAFPFLCSFVVRVVPQLWGGEWVGRTTRWASLATTGFSSVPLVGVD
eukprot:g18526.t1